MYCEDYSELITGYLDGELTETEVAQLAGHLNVCTRCYRCLEDIGHLKGLLKQYASTKVLSPSLRFSRKVLRGIQKETTGARKKISWRTLARPLTAWVAAAAMLLLTLFAGILYSWMEAPKSPPPSYYAGTISPQADKLEGEDFDNIEDYLYQHAMEVSRTSLTDNTVFVGYLSR